MGLLPAKQGGTWGWATATSTMRRMTDVTGEIKRQALVEQVVDNQTMRMLAPQVTQAAND